jgi:hypothetical protein
MTSDHRVAGSSPAGCNDLITNDLRTTQARQTDKPLSSPYLEMRFYSRTNDSLYALELVRTDALGSRQARFDEGPALLLLGVFQDVRQMRRRRSCMCVMSVINKLSTED